MRRTWFIASLVAVIAGVSMMGLAAWGFSDVSRRPTNYDALPTPEVATPTDLASPSVSQSASPSASPSRSPSRKPSPKPSPSRKKITVVAPPPAPKSSPLPSGVACPYHEGTDASKTTVRDALETAAAKPFWTTSAVTLPPKLIKAVAWQESGWQSTIIACDGGIGTMQVMSNTATWMNQRFGTSYDVHTLSGNTMIGSAYLQWLVKYFGDVYFNGTYSLNADDCVSGDPDVPDYKTPCLLNAVIAAYNYGYGAVDTDTGIVIPNPQYVSNVRALMVNCSCFAY
jgi:Transglycosylase SLT domain